ncbi:TetR family transcriptional regulator [Nocardioides korecus]
MGRWEPDTKERLQAAALDLFERQGFEQTSTAEIAAAVGVTERTFFRHFPDKREVLFDGQELFLDTFLGASSAAPASATPLEVVAATLQHAAGFFPDERRSFARRRWAVIAAHPGLQEREQLKLNGLGDAWADALRARGVVDPEAALAARLGVTVFTVAFEQWVTDPDERSLAEIQDTVLAQLRALTSR